MLPRVLELIPVAIILYAAYWAFDIRSVLALRVYRNQALGVGLLAILFVYLTFLSTVGPLPGPYGPLIGRLELFFGLSGFAGELYFVDSSLNASRRSDPLCRDTARWSKLRYLVWSYEIFAISFTALDSALSTLGGIPPSLMQFANFGYSLSFPFVFFVPIFSALILIPVALRARDPQLRGHFRWLGLVFVLVLIIQLSQGLSAQRVVVELAIVPSSVAGYFLYRSARALVPINRTSREEPR